MPPVPLNQFNRLVLTSGKHPTGTYILGLPWNNIHNGSDFDNRNCMAAMGAVQRDAHTGGRSRSTPPEIRNHQDDWSGGIGWDDVNVAWDRLWGERLSLPRRFDRVDVIAALKEGRSVGFAVDYGLIPWDYQEQKGGNFPHAIVVSAYRPTDSRLLRYDPLGKAARWVPQSAVFPAAEGLAIQEGRSKGDLFVSLTRVQPPPPAPSVETYTVSVHPRPGEASRPFWTYVVSGSYCTAVPERGDSTEGFSATCSAPARFYEKERGRWLSLVKLLTGSRHGKYINAGYIVGDQP